MNNLKIEIPKKNLIQYYNNKSTQQIAQIFKCNAETIRRRLIEYKIKRRDRYESRRKLKISKERLNKMYTSKRLSTLMIAKKLNCSQETVWRLMKKYCIKRRDANKYHLWKEVGNIKTPNLTYSPNLAYIIGVILGDGWINNNKNHYFIGLQVKDKNFCNNFSLAIKKLGLNTNIIKYKSKNQWRCISSSRIFFDWFNNLSKKEIKSIINRFPTPFLKGFYESEGCVSFRKDKDGNYRWPVLTIVNTDEFLIKNVKRILEKLNFNPTLKIYPRTNGLKDIWHLRLYGKSQISNFLNKIKPCTKLPLYPLL